MAKVSMVNRQIKREKLVQKFEKKREELKKISRDSSLSNEERFKARLALKRSSLVKDESLDIFLSSSRFFANFWTSFSRLICLFTIETFAITFLS